MVINEDKKRGIPHEQRIHIGNILHQHQVPTAWALKGLTGNTYIEKKQVHCKDCFRLAFFHLDERQ